MLGAWSSGTWQEERSQAGQVGITQCALSELLRGEHKHPVEGVDVIKRAFMVQGLFTPG